MSDEDALSESCRRWGPCGQAVISRAGLWLVGYKHFPEDWELQVKGWGLTWEEAFANANEGGRNAI